MATPPPTPPADAEERLRQVVSGLPTPAAEGGPARRWEVKEGKDGAGETLRAHIFVTASDPGLTTGVIVTTSRRTYYLTCQSVKPSPIRVLRWHYPPRTPESATPAETPGLLPDPARPARYHVGYQLTSSQPPPSWAPRAVVDDGKKLYMVVSLQRAGKYQRLAWRPSQEQKGIDERALMASLQPSPPS